MKTLPVVLGMFLTLNAFAGGSISREAALEEVCAESSNLCEVLKVIALEPVGNAVRLPDGSRIMPYEFAGRVDDAPTWVVMKRDIKGHIVLELR